MKHVIHVVLTLAWLALASLTVTPALAQNSPASPPAPGAPAACSRPSAPAMPSPAAAGALSLERLRQHQSERNVYFAAADATLARLDARIDTQTRAMFASGDAMTEELRQLGLTHQALSRERAALHESFLRLCLAWEDAKLTQLPGGCITAVEGSQTQF